MKVELSQDARVQCAEPNRKVSPFRSDVRLLEDHRSCIGGRSAHGFVIVMKNGIGS